MGAKYIMIHNLTSIKAYQMVNYNSKVDKAHLRCLGSPKYDTAQTKGA